MYKDTSYLGSKLPQVTFSKRNGRKGPYFVLSFRLPLFCILCEVIFKQCLKVY